jgi:hypothetical protein
MRKAFLSFAAVLLLVGLAGAKNEPVFKSVEVKHFSQVEGVELPPEFSDFLYAELRATLQKKKIADQIVGEDEVVDPADQANSVILEGSVLEYKKGSVVKEQLIGFGVGARSLTAHIKLLRRSNNEAVIDKTLKVKAPAHMDPHHLARFLASEITRELKHEGSGAAGAVPTQ